MAEQEEQDWGIPPPEELFHVTSRRDGALVRWHAYCPYREPMWDYRAVTIGHEADPDYACSALNQMLTREESRVLALHLREHGERDVTVMQVHLPLDLDHYESVTIPATHWTPPPAEERLPIFGLKITGWVCKQALQ
jgi:hypothetical protein